MPHRRVLPPRGYLTATRAKKLLGNISDGMLRSYVQKGIIDHHIPQARSQGFYKAEDVQRLASQLHIDRSVQFMRGTVDNLAECEDLLIKIFGTGNPDETGRSIPANPIERRATWITKNPDTFFILRAGDRLVGCIFILPLTRRKIQSILAHEITEPIYADDVQLYTPGTPTHLYTMSACVYGADLATKRFYGSRLLHGVFKWLLKAGSEGLNLESVVSRSETTDGIGLLRHVGFTEIETTTHSRNFLIDVKPSGITEVLRYKAAYRIWLQTHTPEATEKPREAPAVIHRAITPVAHREPRNGPYEPVDAIQPPSTITVEEMALKLDISSRTLRGHLLRSEQIEEEQKEEHPETHPAYIDHIHFQNPARPTEVKRYFTPEQVAKLTRWHTEHKRNKS